MEKLNDILKKRLLGQLRNAQTQKRMSIVESLKGNNKNILDDERRK